MNKLKGSITSFPDRIFTEFYSFLNPSPKIYIDIGFKEFKRIEYTKRRNILKNVVGTYVDEDWVSANLRYKDEEYKIKIRLKGVGDAHWMHGYKWSYRVKIKEDNAFLGMRQITIQPHHLRGSMLEWAFMKMLGDEGLIQHRIDFNEVVLNGKSLGMYAIQEQYDKLLIENNERREGPIVGFSKEILFAEFSRREVSMNGKEGTVYGTWEDSFYRSELDVSASKYASNKNMRQLIEKGLSLLEGFRRGELSSSSVFDYESFAKLIAIRALLGSSELDWRDVKFYVNPLTMKLEPIGREVHVLENISSNWWLIKDNSSSLNQLDFHKLLFSDPIFYNAYLKELYYVSRPEFLNEFYNNHSLELSSMVTKLNKFSKYEFPFETIQNRSKIIRKSVNPLKGITAYISKLDSETLKLQVGTIQPFSVEVGCITYGDESILCPKNEVVIPGKIIHKPIDYHEVIMSWSSKKIDKDSIVKNGQLNYKLIGNPSNKKINIGNWNLNAFSSDNFMPDKANIYNTEWILIDNKKKLVSIKDGEWSVSSTMVFPIGFTTVIKPGTRLNLLNGANLIFRGPVKFSGEVGNRIYIESKAKDGGGVLVLMANDKSIVDNVIFKGLGVSQYKGIRLSGAVTFYESDVDILNSKFMNNYSGDDFLNIVRSDFLVKESDFNETLADAVDFDFSKGRVEQCKFNNIGNDALDFSGSNAVISKIIINRANDKAISVGEKSVVDILDAKITNSASGIASKDQSYVVIYNLEVKGNNIDLMAFQKKPEFGPANIVIYSNKKSLDGYLNIEVDNKSTITLKPAI